MRAYAHICVDALNALRTPGRDVRRARGNGISWEGEGRGNKTENRVKKKVESNENSTESPKRRYVERLCASGWPPRRVGWPCDDRLKPETYDKIWLIFSSGWGEGLQNKIKPKFVKEKWRSGR